MVKYMIPWQPNYIPKVLMLGNGVHRAFEAEDWDALLKGMTDGRFSDEQWKHMGDTVPYPLLAVIASNDLLGQKMRDHGVDMCTQQPPEGEKQLLASIAEMGLDAVLTTNYTYEVEQALIPGFSCKPGRKCTYRYETCQEKPKGETESLYTYMGAVEPEIPPIWHIHGEASKPDTMVIGHYYYGKLLSRIQSYVAETVRRYNTLERKGTEFYPRSWVDYFLFGDVTIIGQGMNLCEMDLWWLFNCKKRNGRGTLTYIEPNISDEKKLLAEAYGARVITHKVQNGEYCAHYSDAFASLKDDIDKVEC